MNPQVDRYLIDGCGRCAYYATPACKVNHWRPELLLLRQIIIDSGLALTEEIKWGVPCYTIDGKNVLMLGALKSYCVISFFKGVLIDDKHQLLHRPGEHSQSYRMMRFTSVQAIEQQREAILDYIHQAIALHRSQSKVVRQSNPEPIPQELAEALERDSDLAAAFNALTPGKQRGYIIYISQPKQSQSRINRIEKCSIKIRNGEGLHDKYNGAKK
jgi:uncharacterized protein YdeI (YjbR/CyaY-like superfamily)